MSKREALTLKGKRRDERRRVPTMKGRVQLVSNTGLTRETRGILNKPKNVQNGPELKEIWSKHVLKWF
jgi:hypothetical protein